MNSCISLVLLVLVVFRNLWMYFQCVTTYHRKHIYLPTILSPNTSPIALFAKLASAPPPSLTATTLASSMHGLPFQLMNIH